MTDRCLSVVACSLLLVLGACRAEDSSGDRASAGSAGVSGSVSGAGGGGSSGEPSAGSSGDDGLGGSSGLADCSGRATTVQEIADGTTPPGVDVNVTGVVAVSQKFLVRQSNSGSCLWAMFASAPVSAAAEYTGIAIVGFGLPATADGDGGFQACASSTDAIPDDVAIGDLLDVHGSVEAYAPPACAAQVQQVQLRTYRKCAIQRAGRTTPPTPAALSIDDATTLAAGTDAALIARWSGALLELSGVHGERADGGGLVGPYGILRVRETPLEIHDKIYYGDLSSTPKSQRGPVFAGATAFSRIDGIAYLDYCTWSLNPRSKCGDFSPKSDGCP